MFSLPFYIPKSNSVIKLSDRIFSIGSCFANSIGQRLNDHKFKVHCNPFGIIYNPYSIFNSLRLTLSDGLKPENSVQNGEVFYHWDSHSELSDTDYESFKSLLSNTSQKAKESLISAKWLIITLGTAKTYRLKSNGAIVANCHKVPQIQFESILLSEEEIIETFNKTLEELRAVNIDIEVILTVSPVRHIRDGLIENNISKATLLKAVNSIVHTNEGVHYFPSYELMIDVLRDYRFYEKDLIHPNELALNYIWNQFSEVYFESKTMDFVQEWQQIKKSLEHKSFHPKTKAHQQFLKSLYLKLDKLSAQVDVQKELIQVEAQLIS